MENMNTNVQNAKENLFKASVEMTIAQYGNALAELAKGPDDEKNPMFNDSEEQ